MRIFLRYGLTHYHSQTLEKDITAGHNTCVNSKYSVYIYWCLLWSMFLDQPWSLRKRPENDIVAETVYLSLIKVYLLWINGRLLGQRRFTYHGNLLRKSRVPPSCALWRRFCRTFNSTFCFLASSFRSAGARKFKQLHFENPALSASAGTQGKNWERVCSMQQERTNTNWERELKSLPPLQLHV